MVLQVRSLVCIILFFLGVGWLVYALLAEMLMDVYR